MPHTHKDRQNKRPAPVADCCVKCGKTIDEACGRRLIVMARDGGLLPGCEDQQTAEKVKQIIHSGKTPWQCQVCAGAVCLECGSPLQSPMGRDVVNNDGSSSHVAIFPKPPGCINPRCKFHLKALGG